MFEKLIVTQLVTMTTHSKFTARIMRRSV